MSRRNGKELRRIRRLLSSALPTEVNGPVAYWTDVVRQAHRARGGIVNRADYLSLIIAQVVEAIQHADRGEDVKFQHEIADVISIAYQALLDEGVDPEHFTVARIREKILPKMLSGEIRKKYRLRER